MAMAETVTPKRIQRRRTKGWRMPAGAVYVGRPTPWGNPYRPAEDPDMRLYREHLDRELVAERLVLSELRGRDLACWCRQGAACHADVLIELANQPISLPLAEMRTLDFVFWDRFVEEDNQIVVYGWIPRDDGLADFVVLRAVFDGVEYLTSSAKYSKTIGDLLRGGPGSSTHVVCRRVEDNCDLPNVIRITAGVDE